MFDPRDPGVPSLEVIKNIVLENSEWICGTKVGVWERGWQPVPSALVFALPPQLCLTVWYFIELCSRSMFAFEVVSF